jgi:hypothetical protein
LFEEFIENFWELKRERERESSGTLLGISGTLVENLLVGNKIKLMCWDLRMGGPRY